jgi:uncharacterized protein YjdB
MRTQRTIPGILAAALALSACGGDEGPTAIEIPLASVEILQHCSNVIEGTTCQMVARGMTAEGQTVTNAVLHWSSNATSIVQVSSEGRVFGIAAGRATITVEAALGQGEDSTEIFVFRSAPK